MLKYDIRTGVKKIKTKTAIAVSAVVLGFGSLGMAVAIPVISHAAGNPSADSDCSEQVTDTFSGKTGTRAEVYGCKSIGHSGDEQGIYRINASAATLGYPADYGDCSVLVKWSGNYEGDPYLNYGTVFNNTKCSNGYVEIWGDNFNDDSVPNHDAYGTTPYVYSIGGQGSLIHQN
jgi:hypothetical protein